MVLRCAVIIRHAFDSPLGWVSRDHRKMLVIDGRTGFITGLCVGKMWVGDPEQNIEPGATPELKCGDPRSQKSSRHSHKSGP